MIHAFSTGQVRITQKWQHGQGTGLARLANTLFDKQYTDWLPIWCFVIEDHTGLTVIDTGIRYNANDPIYFPPYMPLLQRAATFRIAQGEALIDQMRASGLNPDDVHTVILTHLHQDHDGGLGDFLHADFIVSRKEWQAAHGFAGRMGGYLNQRWPENFQPTLVDFSGDGLGYFDAHKELSEHLILVPTFGHSAGHLSVIYSASSSPVIFAGDAAYSLNALQQNTLDGVTSDLAQGARTMQQLRDYVTANNAIFLPSHDPGVTSRLQSQLDPEVFTHA